MQASEAGGTGARIGEVFSEPVGSLGSADVRAIACQAPAMRDEDVNRR
jgi:hypothetical protein